MPTHGMTLEQRLARLAAVSDQDMVAMRAANRAVEAYRENRGPEPTREQRDLQSRYMAWRKDRRAASAAGYEVAPAAERYDRRPPREPRQPRKEPQPAAGVKATPGKKAPSIQERLARLDAVTEQDLEAMRAANRAHEAHRSGRGPELTPEQRILRSRYEAWSYNRAALRAAGVDVGPTQTRLTVQDRLERFNAVTPERLAELREAGRAQYAHQRGTGPELTEEQQAKLHEYALWSKDRAALRAAGHEAPDAPRGGWSSHAHAIRAYRDWAQIGLTRDEMARQRDVQRESVDRAFSRWEGRDHEPPLTELDDDEPEEEYAPAEDGPARSGRVAEMTR